MKGIASEINPPLNVANNKTRPNKCTVTVVALQHIAYAHVSPMSGAAVADRPRDRQTV